MPKLSNPIDKFVEAVNRGETETFLAFLPANGVVVDSGARFSGREPIKRWSDKELIGAKRSHDVEESKELDSLGGAKGGQKEMSGATKRSALLNTGLGSSSGTSVLTPRGTTISAPVLGPVVTARK